MPAKEYAEVALSRIVAEGNVRELDEGSPAFKELVANIAEHGVLEPVIVVAGKEKDTYELVAGFRRVAAAKAAKLLTVPARVMSLTEPERAEVRLLENLLRTDLTPMEEARGIHAYSEATGAKPKEIAARLSKSESWVRDRLRLLNLSPEAQKFLADGEMDVGHAVLIASLPVEGQRDIIEGRSEDYLVGPVDPYFRTEIRQQAEAAQEAAQLRETAAASKFPSCPKCTQPPERQAYGTMKTKGKTVTVQDANGHIWNLSTGAVQDRRSVIDANPTVKAERDERRAERYDRSVNPAVGIDKRPYELVLGLVKEAGDGVTSVRMDLNGGDEDVVRVTLEIDRDELGFGKLPYSFGVEFRPVVDPKKGHVTQAIAIPASGKDRKAVLKVVRGSGWPMLPDAEPLDPVPELLSGSVADVVKAITGWSKGKNGKAYSSSDKTVNLRDDPLLAARMRETEARNKNRGSVLDAIDGILGAHTPTSHGDEY